jgi:hypothetical protein
MATSYSPKIITDGLVLCLDAADKKSLLAPPTTNLANNSNGTINWTTNNLVGTRTQSTVSANDYHYRFVLDKGSNNNIQFRFAFDHTNLTDGETYIISFKYKITSGSGIFYVTDFCDQSITRVVTDIGDGWYYETAYGTRSSYTETYDFFDVRATDDMTVDIKEIQVEHTSASSGLATPFVSYQRQWKDRAGSNDGTPENMSDQSNFSSEGGGSLIFDGASDYVDHASLGSISDFTVLLWFYPQSVTNYENVLDCNYSYNGTTGNIGPRLEIDSSAELEWIYSNITDNNNVFYRQRVTTNLSSNTWHNAAITYSSSSNTSVTYYNGSSSGSSRTGSATGFVEEMVNLNIGRGFHLGGVERYFTGKVSSVLIYNKALTASEILQNYNATKGRFGL